MGTGHCHCGAVRYEFDGEPRSTGYCHCSLCRRLTGSAFAPWCEVPTANLRWTGEDKLRKYNITERYLVWFCGTCGAPIAYVDERIGDQIFFVLGAMDAPEHYKPALHAYVREQLPYLHMPDGLPRMLTTSVARPTE